MPGPDDPVQRGPRGLTPDTTPVTGGFGPQRPGPVRCRGREPVAGPPGQPDRASARLEPAYLDPLPPDGPPGPPPSDSWASARATGAATPARLRDRLPAPTGCQRCTSVQSQRPARARRVARRSDGTSERESWASARVTRAGPPSGLRDWLPSQTGCQCRTSVRPRRPACTGESPDGSVAPSTCRPQTSVCARRAESPPRSATVPGSNRLPAPHFGVVTATDRDHGVASRFDGILLSCSTRASAHLERAELPARSQD